MYGKDQRDLAVTLTRMADFARERTNFNQAEAKEKMAEWLQSDRRFDSFDKRGSSSGSIYADTTARSSTWTIRN